MPTITADRVRIQRSINWEAYREHRAHLADIFPAIRYSGQDKLPLACGVKYDLIGANVGLSAADIKHFLRAYTFGPKYLRALKAGARRYALDGSVAGYVTPEEASYASMELKAHYVMRKLLRRDAVRSFARAA
jgi:sRNA-binding protein